MGKICVVSQFFRPLFGFAVIYKCRAGSVNYYFYKKKKFFSKKKIL